MEEQASGVSLFCPSLLWRRGGTHLLECLLAVQAGRGHLRQQDGHVLLLLPQPDEPFAHVGVHHAQRHLLLPTQGLVEVREVGSHAGPRTLCRARDLERDTEDYFFMHVTFKNGDCLQSLLSCIH